MMDVTAKEKTFDFQLDEFYLDLQEDGRRISILSRDEIVRMPFPGLRPFKTSEFQLYKGRDGQAEELLKRLRHNRFLAVIGSSGTGKSSLVRAGLIPQLFGGYLHEAGDRWKIAICRPGKNPVANLAIALSSVKGESQDKQLLFHNYETIEPMLNQSLYGLLDVHALLNENKADEEQSNLLVIVDQFEELFRYDRKDLGLENLENYFVDLLLKAASNKKNAVYVIITMRSEFLGDCVKYRGLPEAINEGQYLVPGLNRTQLKEVIEAPIHLAGKEISPDLVELLINEIEESKLKENLDQLPILQHALMRTYQEASRQGAHEITYEHYEVIGKMEKALSNHAREKFNDLQEGLPGKVLSRKQQIAKIIFQSLTDASTDLRGGRRPTELKYIHGVAQAIGAEKADVNQVVDCFRDNNTSFIMPPANTALHEALILDISHESLMRNWDLLKSWAEEEVRNGRLYQKINERRADNDLRMPDLLLREMLEWRDHDPHNAVWASRYHQLPVPTHDLAVHEDIYRQNIRFLDACQKLSEQEKEAEQIRMEEKTRLQREEELRLQKEKSQRRMLGVLTAGMFLAILLAMWAFNSKSQATEQKNKALLLAEELRTQKKLADDARRSAVIERDRANALAQKVALQRDSLRVANESIEAKKDRALRLQAIITKQNAILASQKNVLAKQIVEHNLHEEPFYKSTFMDESSKEAFVDALFRQPLTKHEEVPYADYINLDLLHELNQAIAARDLFSRNPVAGLRSARQMWRDKKLTNAFVRQLLFQIFERNIFQAQRIDPSFYQRSEEPGEPAALSVTEGARFAFANLDQLITGRYGNDSVLIDNVLWTPDGAPNQQAQNQMNAVPTAYASEDILAVKVLEKDALLSLDRNGKVFWHKGRARQFLGKMPDSNPWMAAFSPSGKRLAVVSQAGTLELWTIDSVRSNRSFLTDTLINESRNNTIRQLQFSPDERLLLVQYSDNSFEVWDLPQKKRSSKYGRSRTAMAVSFAGADNSLVVVPAYNNLRLVDTLGRVPFSKQLFRKPKDDDGAYVDRISDVMLSPDGRSVLVNAGGNLHLFETVSGDPVFKADGSTSYLTSKKLFSPQDEIRQARFINPQEVMALGAQGAIFRWNTTTSYENLDAAFRATKTITDSSFGEKVQYDPSAFEKVLSANANQMREAAVYYFGLARNVYEPGLEREKALVRAKQLYTKLARVDAGYLHQIDSVRMQVLSQTNIEASQEEASASTEYIDTVAQISQLQQSVKEGESLLREQGSDNDFKDQLSIDYWNLSWYLLFKGKYDSAILAAKRGLEIYPQNDGIVTNLALGYLLKGDFPAAEALYQKYKDRYFSTQEKGPFKTAFLQDFRDLEKAGVIGKSNPKIYAEVQKIKQEILGVKD